MIDAEIVLKEKGVNYQMLYFTSSSLSSDDEILYGMSDKNGKENIFSYNLKSKEFKIISDNKEGILRSYVYFSGSWMRGLGKASVSLDSNTNTIFYVQGNEIRRIRNGEIRIL